MSQWRVFHLYPRSVGPRAARCALGVLQGVLQVLLAVALGFSVGLVVTVHHTVSTVVVVGSPWLDETPPPVAPQACVLPRGSVKVTLHRDTNQSFDLVVFEEGDFLSREIQRKGYWEIRRVEELAALSPRGGPLPPPSATSAFYDVGANVGYYSFLFAAAGYSVVAFEPQLEPLAALWRASRCVNPAWLTQRIQLVPAALTNAIEADRTTTCQLVGRVDARTRKYLHSIPQLVCASSSSYECQPDLNVLCHSNVSVTTLDQYWHDHPDALPPSILKLDVEGHELQVLEGMTTYTPTLIQFENKNRRLETALTTHLTTAGYTLGTRRGHDSNTVAEYRGV